MNEYTATPAVFLEQQQHLKREYRHVISNIFMEWGDLCQTLEKKACRLVTTPGAVILLIPRFDVYDDIFYIAATIKNLVEAVTLIKAEYPPNRTMHTSIIGNAIRTYPIVNELCNYGFTVCSILERSLVQGGKATIAEFIKEYLSACEDTEEYKPRFAMDKDAIGVHELLASEFDFCRDRLPETDEVLENIRKRQVIVIEDNGKIVCTHYFTIRNAINFRLFDVTHIDYRKKFLRPRIDLFMAAVDDPRLKNVKRTYGWRNVTKKKLTNFAKNNNENPDGILIYNLIGSAGCEEEKNAKS